MWEEGDLGWGEGKDGGQGMGGVTGGGRSGGAIGWVVDTIDMWLTLTRRTTVGGKSRKSKRSSGKFSASLGG